MLAILFNGISICVGGLIGYFFNNHTSPRINKAIVVIMGLQIMAMGIKDAIQYQNGMLNVIYLVIGVVIGEVIDIDKRLRYMGVMLQKKLAKKSHGFVKGFIVATLIFCIGSMAVIGPLKIAFEGDSSIVYVKVVLDGIMAVILASTYGIGVIFSAVLVIIYQGGVYLLAGLLKSVTDPYVLNQLSSIGGVLLIGLAVTLLFEPKYVKVTNMLPAMFIPIVVAAIKNLISLF